jgi:pSer/pThr/pTyr-binding forkhead associated (FHA) protein
MNIRLKAMAHGKIGDVLIGEIRVVKGPREGERFRLKPQATVFVGRDPSCQIQILDRKVSRFHLMVESRDGLFSLSDLHSSTGTFVNGDKVTERALGAGDIIRAGDSELEFQVHKEGAGG